MNLVLENGSCAWRHFFLDMWSSISFIFMLYNFLLELVYPVYFWWPLRFIQLKLIKAPTIQGTEIQVLESNYKTTALMDLTVCKGIHNRKIRKTMWHNRWGSIASKELTVFSMTGDFAMNIHIQVSLRACAGFLCVTSKVGLTDHRLWIFMFSIGRYITLFPKGLRLLYSH